MRNIDNTIMLEFKKFEDDSTSESKKLVAGSIATILDDQGKLILMLGMVKLTAEYNQVVTAAMSKSMQQMLVDIVANQTKINYLFSVTGSHGFTNSRRKTCTHDL